MLAIHAQLSQFPVKSTSNNIHERGSQTKKLTGSTDHFAMRLNGLSYLHQALVIKAYIFFFVFFRSIKGKLCLFIP